MAVPINTFSAYNPAYTYSKWDVVNQTLSPGNSQYFYSLTDNNTGNPYAYFSFTPTNTSRTSNVMRLSFTQTGSYYFKQGSIVAISNIWPDGSANYTGTVLAAGPGYVDYLNPGLDVSNPVLSGSIVAPINPYWTTGFAWIPSWTSEVTNNMAVINTQLGENYSQRMTTAINSNSLSWNLVFAERTDKETMAMTTFLQVAGGAKPFVLNFPIGNICNAVNLKYISQAPKVGLTSYGLDATSVLVNQVFDIG